MELSRRTFLAGTVSLLAGCRCGSSASVGETALRAGVEWLYQQQSATGAWSSRTYGLLRGGHSLTPFVLDALLDASPVSALDEVAADRALAFLLMGRVDGALGFSTPAPDYPVYATSLLLRVLKRRASPGWEAAAEPTVAWLSGQQLLAGFEDLPAHGGFPMGRREAPTPANTGHVDLSMTRRAIEALVAVDADFDREAARAFVKRCRTRNDGFVYSPVEPTVNKGASDEEVQLGYGSATADALLAWAALGPTQDELDAALAHSYLLGVHTWAHNPGIGDGPLAGYAEAMRGYWRAGAARVYRTYGGPPDWQSTLVDAVVAEQRSDGSWANPSPLQKEDDPLIATGFAVMALTDALT